MFIILDFQGLSSILCKNEAKIRWFTKAIEISAVGRSPSHRYCMLCSCCNIMYSKDLCFILCFFVISGACGVDWGWKQRPHTDILHTAGIYALSLVFSSFLEHAAPCEGGDSGHTQTHYKNLRSEWRVAMERMYFKDVFTHRYRLQVINLGTVKKSANTFETLQNNG